MKTIAPWLLVVLAAFAVSPIVRTSPDDKPAVTDQAVDKAEAPPDLADPQCPSTTGASPPLCEPVRVIRDFFGLKPEPEHTLSQKKAFREIEAAAWTTGYRLRFFVALVPDPIDSYPPLSFDLALDAIQKGFGSAKYEPDRVWLPWEIEIKKKEKAANPLYREAPGVLLFRCSGSELAVVLLVGESPKTGIQKRAFATALQIAEALQDTTREPEVGILGPTFSGSVDSLLVAMNEWKAQAEGRLHFRIASGSATADNLDSRLAEFNFCRTVVPDGELWRAAFAFLKNEMGWDIRRMALLAEADTAYGQSFQARGSIRIGFPGRISDIRNAWEQSAKANAEEESGTLKVGSVRLMAGRPALNLDLEDRDRVVDQVPNLSFLTTPAKDLELSNLLQTISREGIRFAGVLATDLKDKLFLIKKIRQYAPDTVVFTLDNNLLLAHPQYGEDMDGVVVISSSPLYTEGAPWLPRSDLDPRIGGARRQFISENQQGMFIAVRHLLGLEAQGTPQTWLSVVGNGSLWPLAHSPVQGSDFCQQKAAEPKLSGAYDWMAGKAYLQLLIFAAALCLASLVLQKNGILKGSPGEGEVVFAPANRFLVAFASALLTILAAVLLVVGGLPAWARLLYSGGVDAWTGAAWTPRRLVCPAAIAAVFVYLVCQLGRAARGTRGMKACAMWALVAMMALAPMLLVPVLVALWMPNREIELFQLRARAFGSGLSPLVSLTLLVAALFIWALFELQRRSPAQRQGADCPFDVLAETYVESCKTIVGRLHPWLDSTFPSGRWPWISLGGILLPPFCLLWFTIQPITETKSYGRVFLVLLAVACFLALLSFLRFLSIWLSVAAILQRLSYVSPELKKAFETLSSEIGWRPMRSFAFKNPRFKMLDLSVQRLKALVAAGRVKAPGVVRLLEGVFASEADGLSLDEACFRRELDEAFRRACIDLKPQAHTPAVREFFALRVVVYLRYLFGHLRSSLMGAIGPGLLILLAVAGYVFQPKQFVSLAIWVTLAVAVAVTFWIFLQMDRNSTLSRISGTKPGEITFDKTFWANFTVYVVIPVLSMVATQTPEIGRLLGRVANQLLRVAGGG